MKKKKNKFEWVDDMLTAPVETTIEIINVKETEVQYLPKWKIIIASWLNIPVVKKYLYDLDIIMKDQILREKDLVLIGDYTFFVASKTYENFSFYGVPFYTVKMLEHTTRCSTKIKKSDNLIIIGRSYCGSEREFND